MSSIWNIKQSSYSEGIDKEKRTFVATSYFFRDDASKDASESENKMRKMILDKLKNYKKKNFQ